VSDETSTHTVTFVTPSGGEYVADAVPEDEYLIVAASKAGLEIETWCQVGWCLTCASRLLEGEVDHGQARRFFDEDRAAGFVLPCVALPRSDCRILVGQRDTMRAHRDDHDLPY